MRLADPEREKEPNKNSHRFDVQSPKSLETMFRSEQQEREDKIKTKLAERKQTLKQQKCESNKKISKDLKQPPKDKNEVNNIKNGHNQRQ